jgi:hypothetical protein
MFGIFTGNIVDCIKEGNRHLIPVGKMSTPELSNDVITQPT